MQNRQGARHNWTKTTKW